MDYFLEKKEMLESEDNNMKGFKAFDKNLKCRGMQYEIGKEYEFGKTPIPCQRGYHFCKTVADCYRFYDITEETRICKVEAYGKIKTNDDVKYCTDKIRILEEVEDPRKASNTSESSSGYSNSGNWNSGNWNSGDNNSGDSNSGNWNSGNWNSGYSNSGDNNSGDKNSGDRNSGGKNSGDSNSGNWNSGYSNSGDWNSGDWNSGDWNSGDWNSGDWNSGIFCTEKDPKIKIFDIDSDWTMKDWKRSLAYYVMAKCPKSYTQFIWENHMGTKEKENHPEYKSIGGYLKMVIVTKEEKQEWWDELSEAKKAAVYALPNFDADKFEKCTGIKVNEQENGNVN